MERVLIVKIGAIGDVIMSTSLLYELKKRKAHITWIVGKNAKPLLEATHSVDHLIIVSELKLLKGSFFQKCKELLRIWKQLGFAKFDHIITAHPDPRYRMITKWVKAKKHTYFDRKKQRPFPIPGRYHGDEYLRLYTQDHQKASFPKISYPLNDKWKNLFSNETKVIALAPGGAKNVLADDALRRWPMQHYVSLAEMLLDSRFKVLLTGAKSDEWILPYFSQLDCTNLVGQSNLLELYSLYQKCNLVITHDSGPLHLAVLADSSLIALFGPTNPSEKIRENKKVKVFWLGNKLPCTPCYDGKTYAKCQNNICLKQIMPADVFKEAKKLLSLGEIKYPVSHAKKT